MARTAITVAANPGLAGTTLTFANVDATNGNSIAWTGGTIVLIAKNAGASARTCTIKGNGSSVGGMAIADKAISIAVGCGRYITIADPAGVVQADGSIYLDWDAATSTTVAAFRVS